MSTAPDPPASDDSGRRASIAMYRAILRWYPLAFRDRWAEETALLFAELARRQPPGPASTVALWTRHLPDLTGGLLAEWWREAGRMPGVRRPALVHGVPAGALLSVATIAGNLGHLWATPPGWAVSWLTIAAALTVSALTGRSAGAGPSALARAIRSGFLSGLIALAATNLTATAVVVIFLDRLSHDSFQLAAFATSHETDFRTYQMHELLGAWTYGTAVGASLATLGSCVVAALTRTRRRLGHVGPG
ncbi:hypothetical protein [Dactylosporangium sp. CA-233914]|uniref:hypothetical protein n=1 Tax=Dactylosporangium sp. CA-233914 TaxID=3239934 RepID=UPI003D8DBE5A